MKKLLGFTLAEVLITLGIIGVVAAMTIPTLMSNTNSAKFSSQFKKSLSTLSQAGMLAQSRSDIDYSLVSGTCGNPATSDKMDGGTSTMCALFNGTLAGASYLGRIEHGLSDSISYGQEVGYSCGGGDVCIGYQMTDNSVVMFAPTISVSDCTVSAGSTVEQLIVSKPACLGLIDVNGPKLGPNRVVNCSKGKTALRSKTGDGVDCAVAKDATHTTDVYPIVFHDTIVEPATNAAKAVLDGRTNASGS